MNFFYGVVFIVLGLLLIIRCIFKVKIPVFKIAAGAILILVGISLYINDSKSESSLSFSNKTIQVVNPEKQYDLIFSMGAIDLSKVIPQNRGQRVIINTIFSTGTIYINPQTPTLIKTKSVFAIANTPDNNSVNLGKFKYATNNFKQDSNYLEIEARVIFGKLEFIENVKGK